MTIAEMIEKIAWLGHDGFRIDAGTRIYIDPFELQGGEAADLLLVTHAHYDHCSVGDIEKIQGERTVIVTERDSAAKLTGDVRVVKPGDALSVGEVRIEAVPAYNIDKSFHPKGNGWLGFIVEVDGIRIYHAGDTDFIPEMSAIRTDIALLPVSGTYVMTAEEAAEAAKAIRPKVAIPMHYGAIVGDAGSAHAFKSALEGVCEVRVLEPVGA